MNYVRLEPVDNPLNSVEPPPSQGGLRNIDHCIKIGGKDSVSPQVYYLNFILFGQASRRFLQEYLCSSNIEGADNV